MKKLLDALEKHKDIIYEAESFIRKHPETGYHEVESSKYLARVFEDLGYDLTYAGDIPGFYTRVNTGRPGPEVLILAELDALLCPSHKDANPHTGAAHACGHHLQCATLVGIAAALKEPHVLDNLCGSILLCAVPAEELLEIEYRQQLKKDGIIKYYGGKCEFLSRGYFDHVDLALMVHSGSTFGVNTIWNGFLLKNITYKGTTAHAGSTPWEGNNALYAATCGMNAVNALRETFKERDCVRFHPIITNGGNGVNSIPDKVTMDSYVRGSSLDAIERESKKVNQALIGAALSLNTNIEIIDTPGYAPLVNDRNMIELAKEAAMLAVPEEPFIVNEMPFTASTDMGNLSCIMPVIHPTISGCVGSLHSMDFKAANLDMACIASGKFQLAMLLLLLENDGKRAKEIIKNFKPRFETKDAFLKYMDCAPIFGDRICYHADGTAEVRL